MVSLELDPILLSTLRALDEHRVDYVVIGEVADAVYENGGLVDGLAIVPGEYARNVERLAGALGALGAAVRVPGGPETHPLDLDPAALRGMPPCTLATRHADIELDFRPEGTAGYRDLYTEAQPVSLGEELSPLIASQDDLDRIDAARERATPPRAVDALELRAQEEARGPIRASARRASPSGGRADARGRAPARHR